MMSVRKEKQNTVRKGKNMELNLTREQRMAYAKHTEILDSVKPLPMIPGLDAVSASGIAEYLEISSASVHAAVKRYDDIVKEMGYQERTDKDLENTPYVHKERIGKSKVIGYQYENGAHVNISTSVIRLYSKEVVLLIAFSSGSSVAKAIQNELLKRIKENSIPVYEGIDTSHMHKAKKVNVSAPIPDQTATTDLPAVIENLLPEELMHEAEAGNEGMFVFSNEQFGSIRTIVKNGEPWFVGIDVCTALEIGNNRMAMERLDEDEKTEVSLTDVSHNGVNQSRRFIVINEPGLYTLVLGSRKPEARQFKRWITHDVIPNIRKHGAYMTNETIEKALLNPDTIIKIATALKEERQRNQELTDTNAALTMEANTWDDKGIINALIRQYGSNRCEGNFVKAWNTYYKKLNYTYGISLRNRKNEKAKSLLDVLKPEEIKPALKTAVALCEDANLNTGETIGKTNLARIRGM